MTPPKWRHFETTKMNRDSILGSILRTQNCAKIVLKMEPKIEPRDDRSFWLMLKWIKLVLKMMPALEFLHNEHKMVTIWAQNNPEIESTMIQITSRIPPKSYPTGTPMEPQRYQLEPKRRQGARNKKKNKASPGESKRKPREAKET